MQESKEPAKTNKGSKDTSVALEAFCAALVLAFRVSCLLSFRWVVCQDKKRAAAALRNKAEFVDGFVVLRVETLIYLDFVTVM